MEKLISIDAVGRTVLPKRIREAVKLGNGGLATICLSPDGVIEIRPLPVEGRTTKKVGRYLVVQAEADKTYDAAADVRAERESR